MDSQRPEQPNQSPRVEDDFVRRLTPSVAPSPKRLAAAMPMALAAILVVATVAFGANVLGPIVVPDETPTPVVIGDEQTPEPEITPEPVVTPEPVITPEPVVTPVPADLKLTAKLSGSKVVLTWTGYEGADFAYYKVVRSSDASASWPLGEGDVLVAAISDQATLTFIDCPPTGKTWSYQVFVVKSSEEGFVVLASSNLATIAVPKPTPKPTPRCTLTLAAAYNADLGKVVMKWNKYTCSPFDAYVAIKSQTNGKLAGPLPEDGAGGVWLIGETGSLSMTVDLEPGTYYLRVYVWSSKSLCFGGVALVQSNIVKVVVP